MTDTDTDRKLLGLIAASRRGVLATCFRPFFHLDHLCHLLR